VFTSTLFSVPLYVPQALKNATSAIIFQSFFIEILYLRTVGDRFAKWSPLSTLRIEMTALSRSRATRGTLIHSNDFSVYVPARN